MSVETQWKITNATVVSSEFHYARLRNVDFESEPFVDKSFYIIRFKYAVNGAEFFGTIELHEGMSEGDALPISYNPDDPAQNATSPRKISIRFRLAIWTVVIALATAGILLWNHLGLPSD